MANFVGVLKKTLDGLTDPTPALRHKVYGKARATIEAKLAAVNPPPPQAVIDRQKRALEDAIATLEKEYADPEISDDPLDELDKVSASIEQRKSAQDAHQKIGGDPLQDLESAFASYVLDMSASRREGIVENPDSVTLRAFVRPPVEPTITSGPRFGVRDGKLSGVATLPSLDESGQQSRLHDQIKQAIDRSIGDSRRYENRYPELVNALREYREVLAPDTDKLDVVSVWSVGGALAGFASAYREQNVAKTVSEPLEPSVAAALNSINRLHGAFVLGFEEGRRLVEKADEFLLSVDKLSEIAAAGADLLDMFVADKRLVDAPTRSAHKPIRNYVNEFGWNTSRVGYSAYLIVRNGVFSLLKIVIGERLSFATAASTAIALSTVAGDPSLELARTAIPVLQHHAVNLLAFFNHSPEFRGYVEWALAVLEEDAENVA